MMVRENSEKRDIRPVLLKFGVAIALSLGGILYSVIRTKRIKPSQSPPPPSPSVCGYQVDSGGEKAVMENDYHALQTTSYSCNFPSITADKHEELCLQKVSPASSIAGLSPSSRDRGDKDGFLLSELDELVKVFDLAAPKAGFFPKKDVEISHSDVETPGVFTCAEREDHDQEIKDLKKMVRILRERERTLEIQLLEYYGLKEQETTVMELQNRLKINNMESKLFSLKIESLQADNRRLEAQVADYAKVVGELEAARTKIELLRKKLKTETEQNREHILTIQQRVKKLQDQEHEAVTSDPDHIQLNLQRMKDLEEEAEELRKSNHSLQLENSDLAERLENTQMLATSFLEDQEAEALKAESKRLRQQNEDLSKVIEQLQADRCADVEELVYLRWINACLRYELRNYQPGTGKTIARDLSKTLSPKSEEKAKKLIIEYANKEGFAEKGINIMDYDFDQWSSFHSYLTDSAEFDDSSIDFSSANKTDTSSRTRVLSKLRRLIRGKDGHHHSWSSVEDKEGKSRSCVDTGTDGHGNRLRSSSRHSLDIERLRNLKVEDGKDLGGSIRNCDVGSPRVYKSIDSGSRDSVSDLLQENQLHEKSEKLVKYAEVLKDSSTSRERSKLHRRAASHGPFLHF